MEESAKAQKYGEGGQLKSEENWKTKLSASDRENKTQEIARFLAALEGKNEQAFYDLAKQFEEQVVNCAKSHEDYTTRICKRLRRAKKLCDLKKLEQKTADQTSDSEHSKEKEEQKEGPETSICLDENAVKRLQEAERIMHEHEKQMEQFKVRAEQLILIIKPKSDKNGNLQAQVQKVEQYVQYAKTALEYFVDVRRGLLPTTDVLDNLKLAIEKILKTDALVQKALERASDLVGAHERRLLTVSGGGEEIKPPLDQTHLTSEAQQHALIPSPSPSPPPSTRVRSSSAPLSPAGLASPSSPRQARANSLPAATSSPGPLASGCPPQTAPPLARSGQPSLHSAVDFLSFPGLVTSKQEFPPSCSSSHPPRQQPKPSSSPKPQLCPELQQQRPPTTHPSQQLRKPSPHPLPQPSRPPPKAYQGIDKSKAPRHFINSKLCLSRSISDPSFKGLDGSAPSKAPLKRSASTGVTKVSRPTLGQPSLQPAKKLKTLEWSSNAEGPKAQESSETSKKKEVEKGETISMEFALEWATSSDDEGKSTTSFKGSPKKVLQHLEEDPSYRPGLAKAVSQKANFRMDLPASNKDLPKLHVHCHITRNTQSQVSSPLFDDLVDDSQFQFLAAWEGPTGSPLISPRTKGNQPHVVPVIEDLFSDDEDFYLTPSNPPTLTASNKKTTAGSISTHTHKCLQTHPISSDICSKVDELRLDKSPSASSSIIPVSPKISPVNRKPSTSLQQKKTPLTQVKIEQNLEEGWQNYDEEVLGCLTDAPFFQHDGLFDELNLEAEGPEFPTPGGVSKRTSDRPQNNLMKPPPILWLEKQISGAQFSIPISNKSHLVQTV
mmetsp:Transcript_13370/g.17635  ORF Transcript_13370/g.17635 Transcript_13370/m.17635 type:complete len:835 (+) Transcript_13370:209-2713(+)